MKKIDRTILLVVATHTIDLIRGASHPALAGLVAGVVGISESAPGEVVRRQPAGGLLPLVLSWGGPLDIVSLSAGQGAGIYRSFVAGFMPGHMTTRFEKGQDCVQVYLTPLGVQRILGVPGRELACRVVSVDEVVPGLGDSFADRLGSAPSWRERFGWWPMPFLSWPHMDANLTTSWTGCGARSRPAVGESA